MSDKSPPAVVVLSVPAQSKIVTEYYFSRWVSLAFSILLSSVSGSGYAFGIWSSVLKGPPLNLSADNVSLNASISNLGLYLGVVNGILYGKVGPRITISIGVVLVAFGFICNYLLLKGIGFPASLPLLCFFSFLAQFGSSFLQTSAISTGVRNFPALSRGQIGGLVKGCFALASSILGEYYLALFNNDPLDYLLFVAIYVPVMSLVCMPFINLIPRETVERYQEENERSQHTLHAKLFEHAALVEAEAKDKEKEMEKAANIPSSDKVKSPPVEEEKSKSWKNAVGGAAALNLEMATLSQTMTMADSSTPTNGRAVLINHVGSEGTVSVKFNDSLQEQKKNSIGDGEAVMSDVVRSAGESAVKTKTVTLKIPSGIRRKQPNMVLHLLSKLSPSGPLNPQSMLYGYLFLALGLGVYVSIVAAIQAKETVSQGLRIGGFILTDLTALSFILIGASFGDFRIKFQRVVPADQTYSRWKTLLGIPQGPSHGHGHGHSGGLDESKTLPQVVRTLNFYLMLVSQFCAAGSGLTLINNMSDLAKAYAANDSTSVNNTSEASLLVVIVGFGSFLGRVFCGFISDRYIRYIPRPLYHSAACFLSSFCFALLAASLPYNALYAVALLEGFAYGVAFGTMTTMVADLFGPTHHAAIYGAVDLGPCAGSIVFAYLIKNHFYVQGTNVPENQLAKIGNYCFGYTCFQYTFLICCCVCLFSSILSFILFLRTKEVYVKLVERLENMKRNENERRKQQNEMRKQQQELEEEDAKKLQKLAEEGTGSGNSNELAAPGGATRLSVSMSNSAAVVRFHLQQFDFAANTGEAEEKY